LSGIGVRPARLFTALAEVSGHSRLSKHSPPGLQGSQAACVGIGVLGGVGVVLLGGGDPAKGLKVKRQPVLLVEHLL